MTELFEFVKCHVATTMISVDVSEILRILWKQYDNVRILSYRMTWQSKIVLSDVQRITVIVTTTGVIGFSFILSTKETIVEDE